MKKGTHIISNHLTHDQVIPLLREIPGRDMIANICRALRPWGASDAPRVLFYTSHGEFGLGHCGPDGEFGRIDSAIVLWHADFSNGRRAYCSIGLEIKCTLSDLMEDSKLVNKYLNSGQCDYYFLVTTSDDIALHACVKYADNPEIGVASLSSGRVLKIPSREHVSPECRQKFLAQFQKRAHAKASSPFSMYYRQDKDYIHLFLDHQVQDAPVIRIKAQ